MILVTALNSSKNILKLYNFYVWGQYFKFKYIWKKTIYFLLLTFEERLLIMISKWSMCNFCAHKKLLKLLYLYIL